MCKHDCYCKLSKVRFKGEKLHLITYDLLWHGHSNNHEPNMAYIIYRDNYYFKSDKGTIDHCIHKLKVLIYKGSHLVVCNLSI